jgi:hypothetical protein
MSRFGGSVFIGLGFAPTDQGPSSIQEFCNLCLWEFCEKRKPWVEKDQSAKFAFWHVTLEEHIANCGNYVFMVEPWERFQMKMLAGECVLCLTSWHRFAWTLSDSPVRVHRFINFLPLFQPTLDGRNVVMENDRGHPT